VQKQFPSVLLHGSDSWDKFGIFFAGFVRIVPPGTTTFDLLAIFILFGHFQLSRDIFPFECPTEELF